MSTRPYRTEFPIGFLGALMLVNWRILKSQFPDQAAMNTAFSRREFIRKSTIAVVAGGALAAAGCAMVGSGGRPLYRISLAQWSLNRRFFKREEPHLDNLDFAKTARGFGIDGIEYVNQFFMDKATDAKYLAEMNNRAAGEGVQNVLIMIDREGNLGEPDATKRKQAVEKHYKWADAAKVLDCHSIRVNARSDAKLSYGEQMKLAADGLGQLTEYCARLGLGCIVENHGGLSSNGAWLVGVMREVNHPLCGTLPDFGNFGIDPDKGVWYDRYLGVKEMMPFAKAVSAKASSFDSARPWVTFDERYGQETDYLKMMRIVLDAGYRGWVGIECPQVAETKALLERVHERLASEYS
jgi:L-ribulose-5-phosphate 3-epimerase